MSEQPILYRGVIDGYMPDKELERIAQDKDGVVPCRMFSTTVSGYLLYLTTSPNDTPLQLDRVTWGILADAPNSLGQQGVRVW